MSDLVACISCHRHVRSQESSCPFCSAAIVVPPGARAPSSNLPPRLAAIALAASMAGGAGCVGAQPLYGAPAPEDDAGEVDDAGDSDAGEADAGDTGGAVPPYGIPPDDDN